MSRFAVEVPAAAAPRWERRKQDRPSQLLAAGLDLFVERGYAGTRLDDVAARAGVSKGTLYLYFANKEELFKAVVRESVVPLITAAAGRAESYDGSSADLLRGLVMSWWRDYGNTQAGGITKLVTAESINCQEIAGFFLAEVIEPWHSLLGSAVARGIARGEFRPVDVPTFVQMLAAPLVMLSMWKFSFGPCCQRPVDHDLYLDTLIETMLRGLAAPAAGGAATKRTAGGAERRAARRPVARLSVDKKQRAPRR
ncbi:MAG: TetR/AcrR family transcriptional regulator [Betaproteobacteria bacterium]